MLEFKKVNIFETYGKKVYSDQYGPMDIKFSLSVYSSSSNQWYDDSRVYIKSFKNYERLCYKYKTIDIRNIFGRKLFIHRRYDYGYRNYVPQNDEEAECINISKIKLNFNNCTLEIDKSNKKAFDIDIWVAESDNWEFKRVKFHQLKKGDVVYYDKLGCSCEVDWVHEHDMYPMGMLVIKSLKDGTKHSIKSDDTDLYWVPYEEHKGELAIFNELKNERALSPYVIDEDNLRNVFWQPVEEASQYIVSLYKYYVDRNNDCKNRLYHMKDYVVERNCHFLTLEHLIGGDYIFVVSAENRGGEIIAKSRGIHDSGFPQFWQEDLS